MKELPGGSIVPVAQGVDAFIRPRAFQQAPGLPQLRVLSSNAAQLSTIRQGSGGDVQGFNQWAQLSEALRPFSDALTTTAMAGGQMYAQREYEKGRNDAVRAQILANQQRLQGGAAYSAETRRLEGIDPEAAQMMDRVNPFRQAGRDNQRARLAANEVKTYILDSYRQTPGAETWKPGDPRLAGLKVQATQQILSRFGLDESSAGFQDYVNPEIAQAWDKVTTQQATDHTNFLKDTRGRMAAVEIMQINAAARQEGRISWTEFTATGQAIQRTAALGDPLFMRGVQVKAQAVIDSIRNEAGLRGETTKVAREALEQVLGVAGENLRQLDPNSPEADALNELVEVLGGVNVGPPESQAPAAALFSDTFIAAAKRRESEGYETQARLEKQRKDQFSAEAAAELLMAPSGTPEYQQAVERLVGRAGALGVPLDDAMNLIKGLSDNVASVAERTADPTTVEDLFAGWEVADPAGFDKAAAYDRLRGAIGAMPREMQAEYIQRFGKLAASKDREGQNSKGSVLNPILTKGIRAALEREYPQDVTQAALRGVKDIAGFMALGDANMRTAAARLEEGARKHMLNRLAEAAREKKERLTAAEETAVATAAFNEYLGTKDQRLREYLFPGGLNGGPGVPGGKAEQPAGPMSGGAEARKPPPGRQWSRGPVVSSSNLDNVDPERLKRGDVVLQKPSVMNEVFRVLEGRPPSAAVQRAARAAGMPVAQWLLKQADAYPGSLQPEARRELLKKVNQGQAAGQKISSSARPSPYQQAAGWLADLMLGTRPAMASQGGGGSPFPFSQGQFQGGLETRGGGSFERPESIVHERPGPGNQPGTDFWFPSKRFPAVLPGVVKDVGREGGYGNYVVVESTDPLTGRKVDVLYAHFADGSVKLRPGQRVAAGTILGRQGGTGNVRSADGTIASVDYLAPAPRGSKSMTPYAGFDRLRRHVANQLQNGGGSLRGLGGRGGSRSASSGAGVGRNEGRFLSFLAELESDGRNSAVGYAEAQGGGRAKGRFQFTPITLLDAEQRFGISRRRLLSDDARVQNAAVMEFISKAHPDAAAAIRAGRFARAEQLLNRRWVSLMGGSEQARPERRQRALRFLRD